MTLLLIGIGLLLAAAYIARRQPKRPLSYLPLVLAVAGFLAIWAELVSLVLARHG
jgi:hypothetical protein